MATSGANAPHEATISMQGENAPCEVRMSTQVGNGNKGFQCPMPGFNALCKVEMPHVS